MSNNSLVNLGELSKSVTVLMEKISEAVGGIFKPFQIVRVAKAEAEADIIRANSQIEIQDIHRRAVHRWFEEEAKKQKNMEDIIQKALPDVREDAPSENVENDWITNFFDKCRLISDDEMQNLWSRVLSGEANSPGSYSKRTVNFLSSLDKTDAELFTKLCKFAWQIGDVAPLIFTTESDIYNKSNIYFATLSHLESIGLIQFSSFSGFVRKHLPKKLTVYYYCQPVSLSFQKESDNELRIGQVLLTKTGQELAPICGSCPDQDFFEYVCKKWKTEGIIKDVKTKQVNAT